MKAYKIRDWFEKFNYNGNMRHLGEQEWTKLGLTVEGALINGYPVNRKVLDHIRFEEKFTL